MHAESIFSYAALLGFLFTLARVSCVLAFMPLIAFRSAPESAKIVLALAFTVILWPEWPHPAWNQISMSRIVAGLAAEAGLGVAIGLSVAIVMEVFALAAQAVSLQAGLAFASTVDPNSGADSTVLMTVSQIFAALLFFVSGADRMLVRGLVDSVRLMPPESFAITRSWASALIGFSSNIFAVGLRLAAPVIALLMLADASLAVLGRVQTQLHLVSLTMPVKLGAAMLLMSATIVLQPSIFGSLFNDSIRLMEGIFRAR